MTLLTHAFVEPSERQDAPLKTMFFLHGILGSGANWRTFARKLVAEKKGWRAVLIDLRKHGASQDFGPPHTITACAEDLAELELAIGPAHAILGHSFGGKVALELARFRPKLETLWTIDSSPSARPDRRGSESTVAVVNMLDTIPDHFPTREAFIQYVEERGTDRALAMWLAMNVKAASSGEGYEMRVDLPAMRALLDDYFARDEWSVVENPERTTKLHLVIGGRSNVLDPADRARAQHAAERMEATTFVHVIPNASHWVHVDAPDALQAIVAKYM